MNFSLDFDGIAGRWLFGFALKMRMRNGIAKCIHAPRPFKIRKHTKLPVFKPGEYI